MTSKVVWSGRAERDLKSLHDYIARESPAAAKRYVEALRKACRRLVDYPQSGRPFNDTYRVIVYRNHLVFHRYDATRRIVAIIRVVDARRDLSAGIDELNF